MQETKPNRIHVLAFEQTPDNRRGGQERSLFEVCKRLSKQGVDISLAYENSGNLLHAYQKFCLRTIHIPQGYRFYPSQTISFARRLTRAIRQNPEHDWSLLYVNQYHDLPLPTVLGMLLRLPVVCHLRLPAHPQMSRQYRWGLKFCKRLVAISNHIFESYRQHGFSSDKMRIIPNGIDTALFAPRPRKPDPRRWIIYLGRVTPEKGLDTLLNAYRKVFAQRSDIGLRIVGGGTQIHGEDLYRLELQKRAKACPGTVHFIDHVEDVRSILTSSDLLVLPSEWGEPFGRVLIEAMSCGIPAIASRDGGITEILEPEYANHLFPPGDENCLSNCILHYIDWRNDNPHLGAQMRAYTKNNYSLARTVRRLKSVFIEAVTA